MLFESKRATACAVVHDGLLQAEAAEAVDVPGVMAGIGTEVLNQGHTMVVVLFDDHVLTRNHSATVYALRH